MPPDFDTNIPNPSRVYDYWLGGAHNFASDRELAEKVAKIAPEAREVCRINRAFLRRAVLFMIDSGIDQFIDLGSGMPTVGNVHEIAQRANPECRVVYVDKEPVAVAHSELMLDGDDHSTVIQADLCDTDYVVNHPRVADMIDFSRPVGVLALASLHFLPDSLDPSCIMSRYRDRILPGSYLAISHMNANHNHPRGSEAADMYGGATTSRMIFRDEDQIRGMFAGFELIEPGLVGIGCWRPEGRHEVSQDDQVNRFFLGGVGRKR